MNFDGIGVPDEQDGTPLVSSPPPGHEHDPNWPFPPPKKRGRPPKIRPAPTEAKKSEERLVAPEDEESPDDRRLTDEAGDSISLFPALPQNAIRGIRITRTDPISEGVLDTVEPTVDTAYISQRWGGGRFRMQAVGYDGRIRGVQTIEIAGDPIFQSVTARRAWEQRMGIPSANAAPPIDVKELIALMQQASNAKAEAEAKALESVKRLEIEAEERRRRDEEERDRRRRLDEEERERRQAQRERENQERATQNTQQMLMLIQASHQQTMQFMQAQLETQKQNAAQQLAAAAASAPAKSSGDSLLEAIKTIAVIKETFAGDGGGGADQEENLMAMLVKHGPEWLNGLGNTIGGVVREIKGGQGGQEHEPNPSPSTARQMLPAALPKPSLLSALPPPIAQKTETLVMKLIEKGKDPEKEISAALDIMLRGVDGIAQPAAQPKPKTASAQAAAPPANVVTLKRNTVDKDAPKPGVTTFSFRNR
jgi:hypothetical protein